MIQPSTEYVDDHDWTWRTGQRDRSGVSQYMHLAFHPTSPGMEYEAPRGEALGLKWLERTKEDARDRFLRFLVMFEARRGVTNDGHGSRAVTFAHFTMLTFGRLPSDCGPKTSAALAELEDEGLVEWTYFEKCMWWRLTPAGEEAASADPYDLREPNFDNPRMPKAEREAARDRHEGSEQLGLL